MFDARLTKLNCEVDYMFSYRTQTNDWCSIGFDYQLLSRYAGTILFPSLVWSSSHRTILRLLLLDQLSGIFKLI